MISKYIFRITTLVLSIVLFTSCVGGTAENIEPSRDAQIYTFSMSSRADTAQILNETAFTIDQVGGRIFNREFLPYRFSVDSVMLNITGSPASWTGLSQVEIHLVNPDSSFLLARNDSIAINRLSRIITTAPDRDNTKEYSFQLNIFQQDPFIISWTRTSTPYIASPIEAQKTIALNGRFFTYYRSGGAIGAFSSTDGASWTSETAGLVGLPVTIDLQSIISVDTAVFALNATDVYKTLDGITWSNVATDVVAIYGALPTLTGGTILLVVDDNGTLTFATTADFSTIELRNAIPTTTIGLQIPIIDRIPLSGFSVTNIDKSNVIYTARFAILAGGINRHGLPNNEIWIFEEQRNGTIGALSHQIGFPLQGGNLFFYDNRLYMFTALLDGRNVLMFSERYGLAWEQAGEDQVFPSDFIYRSNASVITDAYDNIWIFGGRTIAGEFSDAWRGRLNRLDETSP